MDKKVSPIAHVCIPHSGHHHYDYLVADLPVFIGARVRVSLRGRKCVGLVVGFSETSSVYHKLRPIESVIDEQSVLDPLLLAFYQWLSTYYHTNLSKVLHFALPKSFRAGRPYPVSAKPDMPLSEPILCELNPLQKALTEKMLMALDRYHCFLLHGVTGSGKTEVYLKVMQSVLSQGKQVLVLVPEIGLTPQFIARFRDRLSVTLGVIHSHIEEKSRFETWYLAATNQIQVVIGTRSALFLPLPNLGLIVIDEEHDLSFKQQDSLGYSARDAALVRAKQLNIPAILGSATPSLESYLHAQSQKYTRLILSTKALSDKPLRYELVDLRRHPTKEGLSEPCIKAIERHLQAGRQVLIFLNRRGYAPVLLCHDCGTISDCPACDRHFTIHRKLNKMICHHCGRQAALPQRCSHCRSEALICIGTGTQRLFQFLEKRFPETAIAQVDRDALAKKSALETTLADIASGKIQLMVGTQLLAKGHHFSQLTLVVIVDADAGLYHQDFRALEQFGQLILQVSGRAGRADLPGEVMIQTHVPQHPMLSLLIEQGYDAFAKAILSQRQQIQLPPYTYMALIRAQGKDSARVEACLGFFKQKLQAEAVALYGPAPALMFKKAESYRWQLCLVSTNRQQLHTVLSRLSAESEKIPYPGVKWHIDVDPLTV